MLKLVMMKGLPGSGKSVYARTLVDNSGYVRINKDDLRAMLHNSKWTKTNEKQILKARDYLIRDALSNGKSVVVDDTNFEPKHLETLRTAAQDNNAAFEVKFIDTPLDVCIEQDLKRTNSVGEKVIRRMYNKHLRVTETPIKVPSTGTAAYIFDIDGTLAHMVDRGPYEEDKVLGDTLDMHVDILIDQIRVAAESVNQPLDIIIMSGRHETCREDTEKWLRKHDVHFDYLYMRGADDNRKDSIVKAELYEEHINGEYEVLGVFDDRDQVVEMWRDKGLKVFQVAEGDF